MTDEDLIARLRAADPAVGLSPAGPDLVVRLVEETMDESTESPHTYSTRRGPVPWIAVAAAIAIFAGLAFWLVAEGDPPPGADQPSPDRSESESTTLISAGSVGSSTERCLPPSAVVLAEALTAFDGDVRSIEDGLVTLTVNEWFVGQPTDVVTVQAPSGQLQALIGAVAFAKDGRFLVAARQDGLMVCGLSAPYDEGLAAMYADAFGG